jgi:hypothetical protein
MVMAWMQMQVGIGIVRAIGLGPITSEMGRCVIVRQNLHICRLTARGLDTDANSVMH